MANQITSDPLHQKMEALEIRSAYQEELLEHLNQALGKQHQEIQQLNHQLQLVSTIIQQLKNEMGSEIKRPFEETPPPHY